MCSICGYAGPAGSGATARFLRVLRRAEERGRDSFGIASEQQLVRFTGRVSDKYAYLETVIQDSPWFIANTRAEPTTEFVRAKGESDIQPFVSPGGTTVSHNGVVANDRELVKAFGLKRDTLIDSAILPALFDRLPPLLALAAIQGSYALAVKQGRKVYLACNFKPIYMLRTGPGYFFASLESHLREDWGDNIIELPPYSLTTIDLDTLAVHTESLREPHRADRVLVICSGGLDSTIVATQYVHQGSRVTLLHFTYGCRAETQEIRHIRMIADHLGCDLVTMDMHGLFGQIGGSRLTDAKQNLMLDRRGERSAEFAYEWVPARNLVFYSLALSYAEAHGFDVVALGNNLEEAGAYPDNEMIFTEKFAGLVPNAVAVGKDIRIEQPVGNLMKHEIVKLGLELGAPLDLTWSCYEAGSVHCGTCGPCYMRRKAFEMLGVPEVIDYAK